VLSALALGAVVVTGAVLAGVLGSRAAQKPKRRPIQVEEVTYQMVTEGLLPAATLSLSETLNQLKQQNASAASGSGSSSDGTTTVTPVAPTTTAPTASAPTVSGINKLIGGLFGGGGGSSGDGSSNDISALVLPEGAVVAPSWKQFNVVGGGLAAASANGRVLCYPKTGADVLEMASMEYQSGCDVLVFTNDQFTPYSIDHTINISRPLLFLGNPLRSPMLNSTKRIERLVDSACCLRVWVRVGIINNNCLILGGSVDRSMDFVAHPGPCMSLVSFSTHALQSTQVGGWRRAP
jgi:hypothetical protein